MATQLNISKNQYLSLRNSGLTKDQIVQRYGTDNQPPEGQTGNLGLITGLAKGAASTLKGAATLGAKVANQTAGRVVNAVEGNGLKPLSSDQLGQTDVTNPDSELSKEVDQKLAPQGAAEDIGYYGEKTAEFFIPGLDGEKAAALSVKAAPSIIPDTLKLFAKTTASDAVKSGAVTAIQTGGDTKQTAQNAAFSVAFGGASKVADKLVQTPVAKSAISYLTEKVPATMVNRILHPSAKDFSFGKNPGQGVLDEPGLLGIVKGPMTRAGLLTKITDAKQQVGMHLGLLMNTAETKSVDLSQAVTKPVDDAIAAATGSGEQTLVDRLLGLRDSLTKEFKLVGSKVIPTGDRNLVVHPEVAQKMKIDLGQNTRWTGQAFDNDVNKVRVQIYRNIDQVIDKAVPGADELNARYANLLSAEKAMERRNVAMQRAVGYGLRQTGIGTAFGLGSYLMGDSTQESALKGFGAAAAVKTLQSTPAQTRIAAALSKLAPGERATILKAAPALRSAILGVRTTNRTLASQAQKQPQGSPQ